MRHAGSLGLLERAIDAVAQVEGVPERLQAARDLLPFVVAKVGRLSAAGDDQAVVVESSLPSRTTRRRSTSTSVTSPIATVVLALSRSAVRSGTAHSPVEIAPAASW